MLQPRLAAIALLLPLSAVTAQSKSYPLSGSRVAVYNLAGKVTVEAGSTTTVEVNQLGSDGAKLKVATGDHNGRNALRVIYPDDRIIYPAMGHGSESDLRVDDDGYFDNDHDSHGHRVEIRGSGSGIEAYADLKVKMASGTAVDLHLAVGDVTVTNVNGNLEISTGSGNVEVTGAKGSLEIDTGSGDVIADKVTGDLNIDTGAGDVKVRGQGSGEIKIDTGSGNITVADATANRIGMDTGSGDIDINGSTAGDVSLDTGSGSVTASFSGKLERLKVETGSGDVGLTVPADFAGTLDLESNNDDSIDIGFPVQLVRKDEGEIHARVGSGTGEIRVETGSGGVRLKRN